MAAISSVIEILLRWVMMLRTRMMRTSGGCRWRSNVGETRRRCGRRDRDWSCRVMVWLTQPAPQTNLPAWGYSDTDCDEDFLEAEAETVIIKFTDTLTEWSAECIAAESGVERETVPGRPGAVGVARITRYGGSGLPRHGDTEHAHWAPPHPRLPSRSRTSWPVLTVWWR